MQLNLAFENQQVPLTQSRKESNKLDPKDRAFHDWYRFVLSYPPHLVRKYLRDFNLHESHNILDPFCGTGTTLVEAKLNNITSYGIEANPFAHFASSVKIDWEVNPDQLWSLAQEVSERADEKLKSHGIDDQFLIHPPNSVILKQLDSNSSKLLLTNSISPIPLHKVLVLLEELKTCEKNPGYRHALLALAKALVFSISNLKFGPEVGVSKPKTDFPVISSWLIEVKRIVQDLQDITHRSFARSHIDLGDSREINTVLSENLIDCVITSPPYPNEKDYTRTTRLESVILGFIDSREELRSFKKTLLRSNTRGVYKGDTDDTWIQDFPKIIKLAEKIEKRRIELGKTSGFERQYARVTKLYFGGMARHLANLRPVLRPGAKLAYVVGDQASYLRVMIRTGQLLAEIGHSLGYEVDNIDLFRTRLATATGEQLREEVLIFNWPGARK